MFKEYEKNYFVYDGWGAGWYFWDGLIGLGTMVEGGLFQKGSDQHLHHHRHLYLLKHNQLIMTVFATLANPSLKARTSSNCGSITSFQIFTIKNLQKDFYYHASSQLAMIVNE